MFVLSIIIIKRHAVFFTLRLPTIMTGVLIASPLPVVNISSCFTNSYYLTVPRVFTLQSPTGVLIVSYCSQRLFYHTNYYYLTARRDFALRLPTRLAS